MNLRAQPFFRLLLPYATGIALGEAVGQMPPNGLLIVAAGLTVVLLLAWWRWPYRWRWVYGAGLYALLLLAGYVAPLAYRDTARASHFSRQDVVDQPVIVVGVLYDEPVPGVWHKLLLRVEAWSGPLPLGGSWRGPGPMACSGNLLVFCDNDSLAATLHYGDRVALRTRLTPTEPPKNPDAFDYQQYLHRQNVHYQAFLRGDSIWKLSSGHGPVFWRAAYHCRGRLLELLHRYFPAPDAFAVASALLVGYKEEISDELRAAYTDTGSMHALAVSGTHVGFVYAGLLLVLRRLPLRGRWARWTEAALALCGIWAFTLVTGATASVLRAAVMFSIFLLGRALQRGGSVWNTLAASAFILLIFNPFLLFDAGCQLSYAAVLGLVFFYPRLYRISPLFPPWADGAWKVFLVGVAAQLGTLPLSLYYFHQFPVYFWLAGWVVVFGGAVFLWGGALLVVLDAVWTWLAVWVGTALYGVVWLMNQTVLLVQRLPGSVINGIWVPAWAAAVLYVVMLLIAVAWVQRKAVWLWSALLLLTVLLALRAVRAWHRLGQQEVVVYALSQKASLIDFFDGETVYTWRARLSGARQEQFAAQAHRWARGALRTDSLHLADSTAFHAANLYAAPPYFGFFDRKLALIDHESDLSRAGPSTDVEAVIVAQNPRITVAEIARHFTFRTLVVDASNSPRRVQDWKAECQALGRACHDVREAGAWRLTNYGN